jgi:calcium-independent phospholipase A2-gamma
MGGVSTTGLLAIMIGRLRMRAHRAREAYVNIAKAIYTDKWQFFWSLDPHVQPPAGSLDLETCIKDLVAKESKYPEEQFFDTRSDSTNV